MLTETRDQRVLDAGAVDVVTDEIRYLVAPVWAEKWTGLVRRARRARALPVLIVRVRLGFGSEPLVLMRLGDLQAMLEGCNRDD